MYPQNAKYRTNVHISAALESVPTWNSTSTLAVQSAFLPTEWHYTESVLVPHTHRGVSNYALRQSRDKINWAKGAAAAVKIFLGQNSSAIDEPRLHNTECHVCRWPHEALIQALFLTVQEKLGQKAFPIFFQNDLLATAGCWRCQCLEW